MLPPAICSRVLAAFAIIIVVGLWLGTKIFFFAELAYTSDLFYFVRASHSFLSGQPLFFDATTGAHSYSHNYFIIFLLAPLTAQFGAYGIFVAHALLYAAAAFSLAELPRERFSLSLRIFLVMALLLGPVGFWLWEHPVYGWHAELLFLPLGVLFVVALECNSRLSWLWGALLLLVREEGPIVAGLLHGLHIFGRWARAELAFDKALRAFGLALVFWSMCFAAHMIVLTSFSELGHYRLTGALGALRSNISRPDVRQEIYMMVGNSLALMLSALLPLCLWIRRSLLWFGACCLASLVVMTLISSFAYLPALTDVAMHGTLWPPRFVMLWTVTVAIGICGAAANTSGPVMRSRPAVILVLLCSIVAQSWLLHYARNYDVLARLTAPWSPSRNELYGRRLSKRERTFVNCLRDALPHSTRIALTSHLYAPFHRHDLVAASRVPQQRLLPEVMLCEVKGRLPLDYGCGGILDGLPAPPYERIKIRGLRVGYRPELAPLVRRCAG